jgi:hypothetical protein
MQNECHECLVNCCFYNDKRITNKLYYLLNTMLDDIRVVTSSSRNGDGRLLVARPFEPASPSVGAIRHEITFNDVGIKLERSAPSKSGRRNDAAPCIPPDNERNARHMLYANARAVARAEVAGLAAGLPIRAELGHFRRAIA